MAVDLRVLCSMRTLAGVAPNEYTVITAIGGSVSIEDEARGWYEPQDQAIRYIKYNIYAFYVVLNNRRSYVTVTTIDGVERLTTDSDTPKRNTLATLRLCSDPAKKGAKNTETEAEGIAGTLTTAKPLNGFWRLGQGSQKLSESLRLQSAPSYANLR